MMVLFIFYRDDLSYAGMVPVVALIVFFLIFRLGKRIRYTLLSMDIRYTNSFFFIEVSPLDGYLFSNSARSYGTPSSNSLAATFEVPQLQDLYPASSGHDYVYGNNNHEYVRKRLLQLKQQQNYYNPYSAGM